MGTLEQQSQMNALMKEQNKLLEAQSKIMKTQALAIKAMVEAMKSMPIEDSTEAFRQMNEAAKEAEEAVSGLGGTNFSEFQGSVTDSLGLLGQFTDMLDSMPKGAGMAIGAVTGGFNGFRTGLSLTSKVLKTAANGMTTLASTMFNLGSAILSVPFKMLNALMDEAANISGTGLRQAIEDTRKEFGELATNEGQAVMGAFRSMRGDLAETGLSVRRVLGNFAERMNSLREMAMALGPAFSVLKESFFDNAEAAVAYQKGLGLTDEGLRAASERAIMAGTTFQEVGREITTMAYQMGESFGIAGKLISRDIGTMMGDFANFGTLSIKTMSQVAVYTRKLGLEMKDLQGVIGKFDDFEDAAKSAAQLNQAFGIQIDTIGMLKDQDPASRFDKLRKAFNATGKDVEKLSRQELGLLASQTGLSEKAVKLGFANRNMGYDEVEKSADKAKNNQLTQAEAMDKLSMSIERMVKEGEGHRGFWDTFIKGITRGIRWSGPFRKMLISLKRSLNAVFFAGIEGGRAIVKLWPGLSGVFEGLTDFFNEMGHFSKKMKSRGFFKEFTLGMKEVLANKKDISVFFKEMQQKLNDIFTGESVNKIVTNFKKVFEALGKGIGVGFKFLIPKLADGIRFLTEFITDPSKVFAEAQAGGEGFINFFVTAFEPAFQALKDAWPDLKDALTGLVEVAWEKMKPVLIKAAIGAFTAYSQVSFWFGVFGTMRGAMLGAGMKMMTGVLRGVGGTAMGKTGIIGSMANKILGGKGGAEKTKAQATVLKETGGMMSGLVDAWKKIKVGDIVKAGFAMVAAGTALTVSGVIFAGGVWAIVKILDGLSISAVTTAMLIMGQASVQAIIMAGSMLMLSKVPWRQIATASVQIVLGLTAMALITSGMAYHMTVLVDQVSGISTTAASKVVGIISAMALMYGEAALVLTVGAGIGFLMSAGFGTGAALMLAGIVGIGLVVNKMAESAGPLIAKLKDVPVGGAGKALGIITAMVGMYSGAALVMAESALVGIGALASFGLGGVGFDILDETINHMISKAIRIMKTLDKVPASSGLLNKVKAFSAVLEAMGSIGNIMGDLMSTASGGFLGNVGRLLKGGTASGQIEQGLEAIKSVMSALAGHVSAIIVLVGQTVKGTGSGFAAKVQAVASVLQAVAALAGALTPKTSIEGAVANIIDDNVLDAGLANMQNVLDVMTDKIPTLISSILAATKDITEESKPGIDAAATLLKTITSLMTALQPPPGIIDLLKTQQGKEKTGLLGWLGIGSEKAVEKIDIKGTLFGPDGFMGQMIDALTKDGGFLTKIGAFAKTMTKNLGTDTKLIGAGVNILSGIVKAIVDLVGLGTGLGDDGKIKDMSGLFASINSNFLEGAIKDGPAMFASFELLHTSLAGKGKEKGGVNIIHKTGVVIKAMVDDVNEMNKNLANISVGTINSTLKKVGDTLGDSQSFELKRNDYTVHVNLNVTMDADEVKAALTKKGVMAKDNKPQ